MFQSGRLGAGVSVYYSIDYSFLRQVKDKQQAIVCIKLVYSEKESRYELTKEAKETGAHRQRFQW